MAEITQTLNMVQMCEVEPKYVSWLWDPYIPLGKLTILQGDPGVGKSYISLAVTAAVTTGRSLPMQGNALECSGTNEPANVLLFTAEDDFNDTVRIRLDKAQADVSKIFISNGLKTDPTNKTNLYSTLNLSEVGLIREQVRKYKPALIVIDPFQAFMGSNVDINRANQTRPILANLGQLASDSGAAVLLIRHLNKSSQGSSAYRGLGSIDIQAAARSVLYAGVNPRVPTEGVMVQDKCSNAMKGESVGFVISLDGVLTWTEAKGISPEELLYKPKEEKDDKTELGLATSYLNRALADGQKASAATIMDDAKAIGLSESTIRRAKRELGVISKKEGDQWYWSLPPTLPKEPLGEGLDNLLEIVA